MDADVEAELARAALDPLTVDITTVGARSGRPRRIEIWIVAIDGAVLIGGTPGRRDWLTNVRADPRLTLHLKERAVADLDAEAEEITDPVRRRRLWEQPVMHWYRTQSTLEELIDEGPLVELRFGG